MDLFISPHVELEKCAAEVELPEDPNAWPKEILDELYKQVPYVSDFQPHIEMSRVDAEQGYGLGHVLVTNQSEAQLGSPAPVGGEARSVRIPVIIRDGRLQPFDLLLNDAGKLLPLTERRLRQALFRPQAFDVTSKTPGDQSMVGQLYPPMRQTMGFGGAGGMVLPTNTDSVPKFASAFEEYLIGELEKKDPGFRRPQVKEAAACCGKCGKEKCACMGKTGSVLEAIAPTINQSDLDRFWGEVQSDIGLQAQLKKNASATMSALGLLAQLEPLATSKVASALPSFIRPSVTQLQKTASGYQVKTASHLYWQPEVEALHRGELCARFGEDVALAVDQAGVVTLGTGETRELRKLAELEPVSRSGMYKVLDESGKELVGVVLTNLLDVDAEPLPLALFSNGSQATIQSDIYAEPAGEAMSLPEGAPGGFGTFYAVSEGGVQAFIPMMLYGSHQMEDEPSVFVGETFDGRPIEVSVQPNIAMPVPTGDGRILIPESWKWMPLDETEPVALAGGDDHGEEEKEAQVEVRVSGDTISLRGEPVEKLAFEDREGLSLADAMFLLTGLGVDQKHSLQKIGMAGAFQRPEPVVVARTITLAKEAQATAREQAAEKLAMLPNMRQKLVKEAAHIPDPMAVDTVLSLGFINPENVMTFVSYLPQLESTQGKLCDMLLAARLGLQSVTVNALERAVRALEECIQGMKVLAFTE